MLTSQVQKYKDGEIVFDRVRPDQKLIVNKIVGKVYHCRVFENPLRPPLVFFEKDLKGGDSHF